MFSSFGAELAFAHEAWRNTREWRVIAVPKSPSQLICQVLFGGETDEKQVEIQGWTEEGLDFLEELLPEKLTAPDWTFFLQVRERNDKGGDWETVSTLRPLRADQRFDSARAMRELDSLIDDGASCLGRYIDDWTDFRRDARTAYREIARSAMEGHPSSSTRRTFSYV